MANIPQRINISDAIFEMSQLGLFKPFMRGNIELSFIKDIEITDDIFCKLSPYELDSVDSIWRVWNGDEKIGTCEECGRFIELTTSNNKYCPKCQKVEKRQVTKSGINTKINILKIKNYLCERVLKPLILLGLKGV